MEDSGRKKCVFKLGGSSTSLGIYTHVIAISRCGSEALKHLQESLPSCTVAHFICWQVIPSLQERLLLF